MTKMRQPKVKFKQGKDSKWYWHVRDTNGEIVANGEGYGSLSSAERGYENAEDCMLKIWAKRLVEK